MSYHDATHLAQTWGLVLLAVLFAAAVVYALWPGNRVMFDRASRVALDDGEDDVR